MIRALTSRPNFGLSLSFPFHSRWGQYPKSLQLRLSVAASVSEWKRFHSLTLAATRRRRSPITDPLSSFSSSFPDFLSGGSLDAAGRSAAAGLALRLRLASCWFGMASCLVSGLASGLVSGSGLRSGFRAGGWPWPPAGSACSRAAAAWLRSGSGLLSGRAAGLPPVWVRVCSPAGLSPQRIGWSLVASGGRAFPGAGVLRVRRCHMTGLVGWADVRLRRRRRGSVSSGGFLPGRARARERPSPPDCDLGRNRVLPDGVGIGCLATTGASSLLRSWRTGTACIFRPLARSMTAEPGRVDHGQIDDRVVHGRSSCGGRDPENRRSSTTNVPTRPAAPPVKRHDARPMAQRRQPT